MVRTPVHLHRRPRRSVRDVPGRCVYESLEDEIVGDPSILGNITADPGSRGPCVLDFDCYKQHPLVVDALAQGNNLRLPLAFYLDGVTYRKSASGRNDSSLGVWGQRCLSMRVHRLVLAASAPPDSGVAI
eukprot:4683552-Pyramimonas_sp.AAC.1